MSWKYYMGSVLVCSPYDLFVADVVRMFGFYPLCMSMY